MSRIVVKNLPKYLTQDRFRQHFEKIGPVTDAKLMYTADGRFRKFGFIGYKNRELAQEAVAYFNNTFIDTSRITVEMAKKIGDDALDRPWSRHSKGSSAYLQAHPEELEKKIKPEKKEKELSKSELERKRALLALFDDDEQEQDPKLKEFLEVMQPRSTAKTWANDDVAPISKTIVPEESDDEEYQDLSTNQPMTKKQETAVHSERLKLIDFSNTELAPEKLDAEQIQKDEDLIRETGRLFVRNLSYECTCDELKEAFEGFGEITEVHIPIDKNTKKSKGFAFILFLIPENAVEAYQMMNNADFQGRLLSVTPALDKPTKIDEEDLENLSFKAKRERERKENAKKDFNWNTLFMNADAVASAMAAKLGVKKSDILDRDAENMAVRLALAETQIINDTKEYLKEQGISLSSFEKRSLGRSKTVIVVKNIPYNTIEEELHSMFSKFGTLGRVILPPARTIAMVEFLEETEAKSAFNALAYSKFKSLPLYLEWAPENAFKNSYEQFLAQKEEEEKKKAESTTTKEETEDGQASATLFVKNLNFNTTDSGLQNMFESLPGYRMAKISTKPDRTGQKRLSMGFGFVEFANPEQAQHAIKMMQGKYLDGHPLVLKMSNSRTKSRPVEAVSSKLVVRNVPFEATKKDLRQLFQPFGQIKSLRLPKKMTGEHRGFAFIDFLTKQEAKSAYENLASTHLYGRHLVREWAEDDDSVDAIRERTRKHYAESSNANKKAKFTMSDNELEE